MSIFEGGDYDYHYQQYLDWKSEQEEQAEEMQEYLDWEEACQKADNEAAERYLEHVDCEKETTGKRIVREVVNELSVIHEEDDEEEEKITQQLAQITVDGVFRYELRWLPDTEEVCVEIDNFENGDPLYYWVPDIQPITKSLSHLLSLEEKDFKIEGLAIFGKGREGVEASALPYELECLCKSTWHDYASEGFAMQFNINTRKDEEEEENWRNNHPTRHGLDGTQCDCPMCDRVDEMLPGTQPYHESVDENRLPTVYESLNLPKRILDALIRNWVASQPNEEEAVKQAAELSEIVRKIAERM
jgi:hypothetical protein